jgi:Double-GTPase 1
LVSDGGDSILLLGESDIGKTHYGAQLLKRLMKGDGLLRMNGAATNLEPYEAALESLNEGKSAGHTAIATYVDSIWPVIDRDGRTVELVWPDYGGEQVRSIINSRRVPNAWRSRILASPRWLLLIRLQQTRIGEDIFSRPLNSLRATSTENREVQISDQARLIELLQFLMYVCHATADAPLVRPRLGILLTCWDELDFCGKPTEALRKWLPMFLDFVLANWCKPQVLGLSALGRPLNPRERDMEYVERGPEHFGYVVSSDGSKSTDLTLPIQLLLEGLDH